jgi:hypothetical protein
MIDDSANLPEWVQSKITVAEDYISTVANYMTAEMSEGVSDKLHKSHQDLRKKSGLPHPDYYKALGKSYDIEDDKERLAHQSDLKKKFNVKEEVKDEYSRKVIKYLKKKYNKEEVELSEGRPSQRHPLEGHDYHKKSNAELIGIAKDAHAAAEAMKGHSPQSENKYRDQANDSATVRYFRQKSGMPDWYKKKYGHVKEDVEIQESDAAWAASQEKRKEKKLTHNDQDKLGQVRALMAREKEAKAKMKKEDVELDEENKPTNPELWSKAKSMAKSKFDVYPSAYANGWAAKKYKEMGGSWKSVKEETEKPASRKAQIVKDIMKNKKNQDETSDKFQKDPEISSEIQKN